MFNAMHHGKRFSGRLNAHDAVIWNECLQAVCLTVACSNYPDPMWGPDHFIDDHPCRDCKRHGPAADHLIKHLTTMRESPTRRA